MHVTFEQLKNDIKGLSEKDLRDLRKFIISLLKNKEEVEKETTSEEFTKDLTEKWKSKS